MSNIPLAERMRPRSIAEILGQEHLLSEGAILLKAIRSGKIPSMILWGPPGVGKTTLARVIAGEMNRSFIALSAINSGVKDVRDAIDQAKKQKYFDRPGPILFIDEIHRFSKSQQDSLLGAVEDGTITLIGATTENPSFEVISALLSRSQVYVLKPLDDDTMRKLIKRTIEQDPELKEKNILIEEDSALLQLTGGDARKLLSALEIITSQPGKDVIINNAIVQEAIQRNIALYDKGGDQHYDIISAFIKSMRGSDPNAAVYWLARMLHGGEDIKFIARRMVILAAEDIGLANPNALLLAQSCADAIHFVGMPEARIILSEAVIYLATSPKSNAAYDAIGAAMQYVNETGPLPVPLHLRNTPTQMMKNMGYGKGYEYSHQYEGNFSPQEYMPDDVAGTAFYKPGDNKHEQEIASRMRNWWKEKYGKQ
ncbi:MAG: replication-associated recombination protein A [Saprospiraceae bacterium]|uniref:Replication-associated recombination protein A n=1 Tax=Candidatus Opimibacter skivensis TaxID=2982028 RepID=A0A9D7SVK1_9BACT|nr:replication-associated recombination protein A [Candidatus Opimibacter skivensis]